MFRLESHPLDPAALRREFEDPRAGAFVSFEGRVREHNDCRQVTLLEYEAYNELAAREGARVVDEAGERFGILSAGCVHRVGRLKVGELAVWIGVTAAHREAAFEACRFIIDQLKMRVPVWKKEHYATGKPEWINVKSEPPGSPPKTGV
jgi:molybdopterin synthase catalytic subunit